MIQLDNVTLRYPGSGPAALRGVTFTISPGIYLLLGENGAGKTTLLRVLASLLTPSEGRVTMDGVDAGLRLPSQLRDLYFIGDDEQMPADSVDALARLHGEPLYPLFDREMLRQNLADFGLDGRQPLSAMSLGQRKKAMAAYALSLQTPLLLLDEPANGLDIGSRDTLRGMMARCAAPEQTIIVSTHTTADLEPLYDGIIMLSRGELLFTMRMDEITRRLAFGIYEMPPRDALFSMNDIGRFRSITPAGADAPETEVDIHLLYSALQSEERGRVMTTLSIKS
ncbi:MAG: ABC transporter ATP-binding protein [Pseudoflavonifractor sp.]|nr:ABC transporter ATP-binding protein [Alloprevotella sp.]MCM1117200.1 ABC transporter ATP-binding protein [Pseudoflavonifractor sp.]